VDVVREVKRSALEHVSDGAMRDGSAVQRLTMSDLSSPGATLAAGVTSGFFAGLLIGGVGGRLAMLLLRLTSDPGLRGTETDDGFTIGVFSTQTLFLLGVTAGLGILGGLFYLIVRGWLPEHWRVVGMTVFIGLVGGAGLIRPEGIDFKELSPLPLAVAMFVAIAVAYGAVMPWLTERMLREGSVMRRGPWAWIAGLLPLVVANIVGILVLLLATLVLLVRRSAPSAIAAWRSPVAIWIGRTLLFATAVASGIRLVRDSVEILS
jgi:hypothetical protein